VVDSSAWQCVHLAVVASCRSAVVTTLVIGGFCEVNLTAVPVNCPLYDLTGYWEYCACRKYSTMASCSVSSAATVCHEQQLLSVYFSTALRQSLPVSTLCRETSATIRPAIHADPPPTYELTLTKHSLVSKPTLHSLVCNTPVNIPSAAEQKQQPPPRMRSVSNIARLVCRDCMMFWHHQVIIACHCSLTATSACLQLGALHVLHMPCTVMLAQLRSANDIQMLFHLPNTLSPSLSAEISRLATFPWTARDRNPTRTPVK
jgi:hypothetical protein